MFAWSTYSYRFLSIKKALQSSFIIYCTIPPVAIVNITSTANKVFDKMPSSQAYIIFYLWRYLFFFNSCPANGVNKISFSNPGVIHWFLRACWWLYMIDKEQKCKLILRFTWVTTNHYAKMWAWSGSSCYSCYGTTFNLTTLTTHPLQPAMCKQLAVWTNTLVIFLCFLPCSRAYKTKFML